MNSDNLKAQAFIARLLQNPALKGFSLLQREEQIIQFLHVNAVQLAPTLSSPQFFPGKSWPQIFAILVSALIQTIDTDLIPEIETLVSSRIDYTFFQLLRPQQGDTALIHRQVMDGVRKVLARPEARREMTGPYTAVSFNLVDRYLDESFFRKTYIHFELTKVQRLRLGKEHMTSFVNLNLLLKPAVYLYVSSGQNHQDRNSGMIQNQFAEKATTNLLRELRLVPEQVLKSVAHSSVSFTENRFIEATARLAAVFSARSRSYQAGMNVDRGADTPDKSFFSTARRNYKFYGFDVKVLDELYKIAAENLW